MAKLKLSQVVEGFFLAQEARQLAPTTMDEYRRVLRRLGEHLGDVDFRSITPALISGFLLAMGEERDVAGVAPRRLSLSKKSLLNHHTALSALWSWCVSQALVSSNILKQVERARPEQQAIVPFSQDDCRRLMEACTATRPYRIPGRAAFETVRPTAARDQAIVLMLLDTGMRATELCEMTIASVDLRNRRAVVMGKNSKERFLPFSPAVGQAVWMYLRSDRANQLANAPLFGARGGETLSRNALLQLCGHLGDRAGVADCHPHRFRHTFAITYLRNGGSIYELQAMLGHASLDMVKHYLDIAQADVDRAHHLASPVANWRLKAHRVASGSKH